MAHYPAHKYLPVPIANDGNDPIVVAAYVEYREWSHVVRTPEVLPQIGEVDKA
jgi:hypothetical protein